MLEVRNLTKRYGDYPAVRDISFSAEQGQILGFLGPNGAGKTTTIRMMTGLLEPSGGQVLLGGHDLAIEPEAAKALLGYVPDQPFLYDKLTAKEFLSFIGGLYRVDRDDIRERSIDLLEEFGLVDRTEELVETFSHGMKQRLALAAALIHRPKILILDEPMVGMDPQGALALRHLLGGLAASGVTIFLSTHSLPVAEELCDRIGILDHGKLIAQGTLDELRVRASEFPELMHSEDSLESVFLSLTGTEDRRA